jgi:hypothetical protein
MAATDAMFHSNINTLMGHVISLKLKHVVYASIPKTRALKRNRSNALTQFSIDKGLTSTGS